MSDDKAKDAADSTDPKELMRQALERKKRGGHGPDGHGDHHRSGGKAQGQAGGRREFRRKAGG